VDKNKKHVTIQDDVVIGKAGNRDLLADLFLPPSEDQKKPAIVVIHGGGWMEGDKTQLRGYGILLSQLGFVCLCASYRLSQEAKWPSHIHDVKCAIRYLKANAEKLGLDPNRIGVTGNSAGGHLALMCASDEKELEGDGGNQELDSKVKAICAMYPPTLVREEVPEGKFNAFAFMMGDDASSEDYMKASPIKQDLTEFPPCLLIHGSTDKVVPISETTDFQKELEKNKRTVEVHIYADEDHAFDSQPSLGRNVADIQGIFFLKYL
tara:strand:+ start:46 stop:840 length:795 start_codon:yes stop_codon:yes gene_type:complete